MSNNDNSPQTGIIIPPDENRTDNMGALAHSILDDIVYNIIHDLVLKIHREEKMSKGSTAAILIERKAAQTAPPYDESNAAAPIPTHRVEVDSAIYENGKVYLKENPLKTTGEIICPKCHLPRLLYPSDGAGARKPDPLVEYCKKRPYIEKPYHDIYGQTFQMEGPGRGKKKKDMINPLLQSAKEGTPSGSQDSPNPSPPPSEGLPKPISFPHSKCQNCNTFLPIKRMNNHMVKCIGGGGRDSSRAALLKIQSNGNGSQNGNTPPGSRAGTPAPPGVPNPKGKSSPNKREAGDDFESDSSPQKKKKVLKKNPATKLKAPKMAKSASQMSSSNLSFEQKAPGTDDEDDDGDDDNDGDFGASVPEPKKKAVKPVLKKAKDLNNIGGAQPKKKWLHGKGGVKPNLAPPSESLDSAGGIKLKIKNSNAAQNGGKPLPPKNIANGSPKLHGAATINGKSAPGVVRADSESSQTLSSPN
ncbi:hypothetical protein BJ875DRAFT_397865 [Amylocarpus encephaloides]|uniref:SAGA-associated factor 11 n=1 Tax=Amylocarpus encephaloides TaxID=45428 RepID=A0A9P7YM20_9HELO|nr:hypothetical protein BJ875DRAFT_397865 [Amylocarpus encephaloides]